MSISLTEKQIFCNTKPGFSFIFCNVAKNSFQKTSLICEYDRFLFKSYRIVSFCVFDRHTTLYTIRRHSGKKPHFTAFLDVLPAFEMRTVHTKCRLVSLQSGRRYGTVRPAKIHLHFLDKNNDLFYKRNTARRHG